MRREQERVAEQLQALERRGKPADIEAEAEKAAKRLLSMEQELDLAPPARLRELLGRMVGAVNLFFDHVPRESAWNACYPAASSSCEMTPYSSDL